MHFSESSAVFSQHSLAPKVRGLPDGKQCQCLVTAVTNDHGVDVLK